MNRNSNTRFSLNPATTDIQRSTFTRSHAHTTTFNAADLVPVYYDEILASDTFRIEQSSIIRSQTPIHPVMDDAFLDTYFFFVPFRLVWEHWKNFMGENTLSAWVSDVTYTPPKVTAPGTGFAEKSIADYFGMPTKVAGIEVDAMRFRGYRLIWNEWFRSEAIQDPELVNLGDDETDTTIYGDLLKANKIFDMFTGALPAPQRGEPVTLPLIGDAPLYKGDTYSGAILSKDRSFQLSTNNYGMTGDRNVLAIGNGYAPNDVDEPQNVSFATAAEYEVSGYAPSVAFINTYADMSQVSSATVTQLRQAFAVQRLLEADARGGGRYRSLLRTHFGASVPDATVQIPEYLGGMRQNLRTQEVVQTSATSVASSGGSLPSGSNATPQGNTAAMSKTVGKGFICEKSFTEPGMIIGVACVRQFHTYQQGIPRDAMRTSRYDYYWPELAHISEVGIKNAEIFVSGDTINDGTASQIFGYQEPWYEYRYKNNYVTGEMRSNSQNSLDIWHYADDYDAQPVLSSSWLVETDTYINRTLAVQSPLADQFLASFYFDVRCTRPMPLYSVPGLTGHY